MIARYSEYTWQGNLIDAYAHVGDPKYGTLNDVEIFFERLNIKQGVLVLGPGIPDLDSLMRARQRFGNRIRVFGIPYGDPGFNREAFGELQLRMGISGMRLMPDELEPNRRLIDQMGRQGLWLYAINLDQSAPAAYFLLEWLERHPEGKVAAPHFLRPQRIEERVGHVDLYMTLLQHPRFHAIFSRHGGNGSAERYPHEDLRPWVEQMAELVTWQRILWGSEFPIFYQRNEQPEAARDWLLQLGVAVGDEDRYNFYAGNAQRLFFDEPPPAIEPPTEPVEIPDWVAGQIDQESTVYLFPDNRIFIPMQDHRTLLSAFLAISRDDPQLSYADFIAGQLSDSAARIRSREEENAT